MTYLEEWRARQREDEASPADIREAVWLASLTPDTVRLDHAATMSPAEVALLRRLTITQQRHHHRKKTA